MSIYEDGPWADAATDVEAERTAALLSTATVEAAPIMAFMVASESSEDFATRLALMEDRIHSVASVVAGEGTPGYTSIIASLPEQFHARWQVAFEARQAAAQARNAPRAAARAAAREATKQAGAIEGIDCPGGFVKGDFKQGDKITCPECGQETYASPASGRFFEDDGTPYTGAYTYVHLLPGKTLDDRIRHDHGASRKQAERKAEGVYEVEPDGGTPFTISDYGIAGPDAMSAALVHEKSHGNGRLGTSGLVRCEGVDYRYNITGNTIDIKLNRAASKKVAVEKVADGWCCTDCLMLIANGDTSGYSGTDAEKAEWLAEVDRRSEGINWVPGDAEEEFSTRQCDVCGSMLAGARHEVVGLGTTAARKNAAIGEAWFIWNERAGHPSTPRSGPYRTEQDADNDIPGDGRIYWVLRNDGVSWPGVPYNGPTEIGQPRPARYASKVVSYDTNRNGTPWMAGKGEQVWYKDRKATFVRYDGGRAIVRLDGADHDEDADPADIRRFGSKTATPDPMLPGIGPKDPGFGSIYGGSAPAYVTTDGVEVWMWRKGQKVRFYTADGTQVGPEQPNVAPAVAYALSNGWTDPGLNIQWTASLDSWWPHVAAEDNSWPPKDGEEKKAGTPEAPPAAPGAPADPNQAQPMQNAGGTAGAVQQGDVLLDAADGTAHSYVVNQMTDQGDTVLLDVTKDGGEQMQLQIPKIEQVQVLPSNNASPDQPVAPPEQAAPADPENPADPAAPVDPATDHGAEPTDPADPSQRPDNPFATDKKPDAEGDKNDPETEESQVKADDPEDKEEDKEEDDDDKKKPSFAKGSSRRLDLGNGLIAILPDTTATLRDHSRVASFGPPVTKRASMPTIPGLPSNVQGILSEQDWYDQWGAAMESLWGIAEAMAAKGERAPVEHSFGAGGAPSEEDIANDDSGEHYTAQGILEGLNRGDFTMADLEAATRALDAYCDELKAQGKDY